MATWALQGIGCAFSPRSSTTNITRVRCSADRQSGLVPGKCFGCSCFCFVSCSFSEGESGYRDVLGFCLPIVRLIWGRHVALPSTGV